ncbi:MAG: aldehyde ferredoxin oxidoreductase family protein [Deltaproteobacteria bacterium]|nr:aldehyde ferredoxin oxidoreductase family protein [Deltaproteobacteria bacterium]
MKENPIYGYHGNLLRIDLSRKTSESELLDPEDLRLFLGGRGLGAALLLRETSGGMDPLSEENPLIFSTGPLVGTGVPGSNRFVLHTKSPQTGLYLFCVAGGHFGRKLKKTGFDVILIQGRSEKPVYLFIDEDRVRFREAGHLWGVDTERTQEFIRRELRKADPGIACIGPAGENRVPYACIITERRALGRGGAGAVMGSKNLKALVVEGRKRTPVADQRRLKDSFRRAMEELGTNPMTSQVLKRYGSASTLATLMGVGVLPGRNWSGAALEEAEAITAEELRDRFLVMDTDCSSGCPIRCSKIFMVREGRWAGALSEGPDYETLYALGSCCGIYDLATIIQADSLCDRWGLDTISTGVSIAFAMECIERGILDPQRYRTGELRFGNSESVVELIRDIAMRRGFGDVVARGTRRMAEILGQGSERFAMHAKGMELGGYDPRGLKGMGLVYACGPRGGCHHSGGFTVFPEIRSPGIDRFAERGKAPLVAGTRNRRASLCDSGLVCAFVAVGLSDATATGLLRAVTGVGYEPGDLFTIGDRISCTERAFNFREGLRREDDVLPGRLTEDVVSRGPSHGHRIDDLEAMKDEFYGFCGWDLKTGAPTGRKLKELGIGWVKRYLPDQPGPGDRGS